LDGEQRAVSSLEQLQAAALNNYRPARERKPLCVRGRAGLPPGGHLTEWASARTSLCIVTRASKEDKRKVRYWSFEITTVDAPQRRPIAAASLMSATSPVATIAAHSARPCSAPPTSRTPPSRLAR